MRRSLIFVSAGVASAGTLAMLELGRRAPLEEGTQQTQAQIAYVLVFVRDLPRGTVINDTAIGWQEQLRSALPPDAIMAPDDVTSFPEDVLGKVLRGDILTGEMVRVTNFVDAASGFMALALSPGMRAVGLSVTPQKLAGGFILPDDRIDLIHTTAGDFNRDGIQGSFSQTILANIRVLAVGDTPTSRITLKTADQQEDAVTRQSDVNLIGDTITLEMSDEEAEILFSALASGQVSLALRALDDHGKSRIVSTVGFETSQPALAEDVPPEEPAAEALPQAPLEVAPTPPANVSVRIIEGGSVSIVDVPAHTAADRD
jgi:pilus assembly protein CpaB